MKLQEHMHIRFSEDKVNHKKALEYLHKMDRQKFSSYADLIALAVVEHFERDRYPAFIADEHFFNELYHTVESAVKNVLPTSVADIVVKEKKMKDLPAVPLPDPKPENAETELHAEVEEADIPWDFLGEG